MLEAACARISSSLPDDALVLDVGGWARPFARADWVLDRGPYGTRGGWGRDGEGPERFGPATWVMADVCARAPWPFGDGQFDFAICSHTLEDVRDPVWVCAELQRVARAGYIEVPSRLEEQTWGIQGPWVGWGHHHWLVDVDPARRTIGFVFKHHTLHGGRGEHFPAGFAAALPPEQRVQSLWWEGGFSAEERIFDDPGELSAYLTGLVREHAHLAPAGRPDASLLRRAARRVRARRS